MKKLFSMLLLLMTVSFAIAQQPFVTLNGHVTNQETGNPVAGQTMFISVDSLNYPGYYNQVLTDETGFYSDQIPFMPGTAIGVIMVYTYGCNGTITSGTGVISPGIPEVTINFSICSNPTQGCVASFKPMPSSNDLMTFNFTDESYTMPGATIDNRFWDFGDGTYSNEQNPVHTYSISGLYNACLYISSNDSLCNSSFCIPVSAGSTNPLPCENSFWYRNDSTGTGYIFEGKVMNGQAETYAWDFGDGTTATGQIVTHSFASPNTNYLVCLTTTAIGPDGTACSSISCQDVYIYIPSPCENSFWYYPDSTGTGFIFEGWAQSNQIDSWYWDFGDGTTATGQTVSHSFASQNTTYNVCLTTAGSGPDSTACTSVSCQEVYIYVPSPCESTFWYYPDSTGSGFTFEAWAQTNLVNSWTWDFGDGTTATGKTVFHSFAAQNTTYTVCLTTTGTGPDGTTCTSSYCQDVFIYVPSPCESSFWYYPDSSGAGFTFEGWADNNQIYSWNWDFGDGTTASGQTVSHSFTGTSNIYNVCLTTTGLGANGESCTFVSCQQVYISIPSPCENYFKAVTDDGFTYSFSGQLISGGQAYYSWNFGDGASATGQTATHTFAGPGSVFNVCLTTITIDPSVYDSCFSTSCQVIYPGGGSTSCEAIMSVSPDPSGYTFLFRDLSPSNHSFILWDFGDGTIQSNEEEPLHTYSKPGMYWACLTIGDSLNNCWDQTCQELWVDIVQPDCQASFFAFPADSVSASLTYKFINTSVPGYSQQLWSFGDGTESSDPDPVHTYTTPGIYKACLTITDSSGTCQNTYCMEIFAGQEAGNYTVAGIVLAGNTLADQGIVWLIGANNYYYSETLIGSGGAYNFSGVPAGSYYIYAMLTPGSVSFFEYLPSYYANSLTWQGATIVSAGEPNGFYPISLVPSIYWSQGSASITGTISWGGTFKQAGNPASNVEIVLFNSTGAPIAYAFSNSEGTFAFNNLPYGEYTLHAEMTGKITETVIIILSESSPHASINFLVTEAAISALGNNDHAAPELYAGNPYPNPTGETLYLDLNAKSPVTAVIDIADLQGRMIQSEPIKILSGKNHISISTGNLSKGMYILRLNAEGRETLLRRFIK